MSTFVSNLIFLGFNLINADIYLTGILSLLNKLIFIKHLEHCLIQTLFVKITLKIFFGGNDGKIYI